MTNIYNHGHGGTYSLSYFNYHKEYKKLSSFASDLKLKAGHFPNMIDIVSEKSCNTVVFFFKKFVKDKNGNLQYAVYHHNLSDLNTVKELVIYND